MLFFIEALQSFNLREMHLNTVKITRNWSLFGPLGFSAQIYDF